MLNNQNGSFVSYETWMAALASSACIGFTSLVPWLFNLTFFEHRKQRSNQLDRKQNGDRLPSEQKGNHHSNSDGRMKYLMSFAVGAILGDIFFHLLPESQESYGEELGDNHAHASRQVGIAIIAGVLMFFLVELMLKQWSTSNPSDQSEVGELIKKGSQPSDIAKDRKKLVNEKVPLINNNIDLSQDCDDTFGGKKHEHILSNNNNDLMTNLNPSKPDYNLPKEILNSNTITRTSKLENLADVRRRKANVIDEFTSDKCRKISESSEQQDQMNDVDGYLSLIANGLDNFNHGLAIGASFLVGTKVGLLTTFVIFIHEIPHEICDYAILVNSGFSRLEAVKAQSSVSLFTILGTATALYVKSVKALTAHTLWILPFSAGGFLYIALVNLLPEILDRETDMKNSIRQIAGVMLGIGFMVLVAFL